MKFYEFNDFEYYALILSTDEIKAKEGYGEVVADLDEIEKDLTPDIIAEKSTEKYLILLIDGTLI
ncbi:hypothetical protein AL714_09465 [Clostridium botulinum]|uniref:Uncharacterized protein n=1 Tax=Clostridium botulinum TaxID=1491 RepID=A0ABD7CNE1_CLOBO|nr:hypothetical protein [Clostridium botulinum]KGO14238.1 hypothetical protein NZ45_08275 [Clostridium botulinum]KIN79736.1 hypothetical protein SD74_19205 [Clostridium botulinum]MCC5428813.1 hypothetical protein [Clostridium botulinum]NFA96559.1 hypothetical protein [Clostridium botulinum]NFB51315.1 hypothetical protein [Clostridium botulinum]